MAAVQQLLSAPTPTSAPTLRQSNSDEKVRRNLTIASLINHSYKEKEPPALTHQPPHDLPQQGDTRVVVIVHGSRQEHVVGLFAEVLGRTVSRLPSLQQVTSHHSGHVIGITADQAKITLPHKRPDLHVVIHAHCVDDGMPPDVSLSTACDFEFLYNVSSYLRRDLARFTSFVLGQSNHHDQLMAKARTYFISTTFPDVRAALPNIDILTVGSDAVEIRVDLLQEPLRRGGFADIPSLSYVGEQVMLLRQRTELPIIFTTRSTDFANGRFPIDNANIYYEYLSKAIQWGLDYVDVELWLPEDMRRKLFESRGSSRIMSAFHDFSGDFRWSSAKAEDVFVRSMKYADIIKMIVIVGDQSANFELEHFRTKMSTMHPNAPPFSAVNMGEIGQLSRTLNRVFTPVTHPLLPIVAAPGQMSTAQINESLASLGHLPRKAIYGISTSSNGGPLAQASFFEKCFNELGLPHQFVAVQRQSSKRIGDLNFWFDRKDFGGAYLDSGYTPASLMNAGTIFSRLDNGNGPTLSDAVQAIGTVDTVIVESLPTSGSHSASSSVPSSPCQQHTGTPPIERRTGLPEGTRVRFENVGWRGVLRTLTKDLAPAFYRGRSAIVLASSSHDATPSLFAIKALGISRIYTVGFKIPEAVAASLPTIEPVASLETLQRARSLNDDRAPVLIVSALSSEKSNLVAMVVRAFGNGQNQSPTKGSNKVFLDLAEIQQRGSWLAHTAEQSGFAAYGAADVAAFTTVESLRLLVGQNVPYSFVRLTNGTETLGRGW